MAIFLRYIVMAATLLLMLPLSAMSAQSADVTLENRVKAAYVYNILKFTHWQNLKLDEISSPINICILGEDSIAEALEPVTKKTAQGRSISLETIGTFDSQKRCQVLFVSSDKHNKNIIEKAGEAGALTLSSHDYFAVDGGMIGFVIRDGKVHMEVNVAALRQAGIKLSSKLLEISTLIKSSGDQKR